MKPIGYLDLSGVTAEATQEETELLGLFQGQRTADRMIMILDGEALRLIPKSALWAKVRAGQIVREQEQRDADRELNRMEHCQQASRQRRQFAEDRRKKRREDKARTAGFVGVIAAVTACAGMIGAGAGSPLQLIGAIGALLLASAAWTARKAVR